MKIKKGHAIGKLLAKIDYLERILKQIPGNIYWKDKNNKNVGYNNATADFFSKTDAETAQQYQDQDKVGLNPKLIGLSNQMIFDNIDKRYARILNKNDQEVLKNGKSIAREEPGLKFFSDPTDCWLSLKSPIIDENGKTIGLVGNSIHLGKIKKAEARLKKALDLANTANKAKQRFLENLSHDLRTPFAGFIGLLNECQNLLEQPHDLKFHLDLLEKSIQAFSNYCNNLIDLTAFGPGEKASTIKPTTINLNQYIRTCIDLLEPLAIQKGIEIHYSYSNDLASHYQTDGAMLSRIVTNILSNAIKFTHQGHINIVISPYEQQTHITIQDTGIGIDQSHQSTIFERFSRISSNANTTSGLGLGLYIAKSYAKHLGGNIHLSSKIGVGSTFIIELPLIATKSREPKENELKTIQSTSLRPAHILIIEDNALAAYGLQRMLQRLGLQASIATSGSNALKAIDQTNFDLMFIDIGLPDITGFEVIEKIISNSNPPPLYILSGHMLDKRVKKYGNISVHTLQKPISYDKLKKLIHQHFAIPI